MNFYKTCFGGQLECKTYADAPKDSGIEAASPGANKDSIMHACLQSGDLMLMAADWAEAKPGNTIRLSIDGESREQIETLFNALSAQGKIDHPLKDTFWGAYFGMVTDQFGMQWMLNYADTYQ